jgi:hypothetical protein
LSNCLGKLRLKKERIFQDHRSGSGKSETKSQVFLIYDSVLSFHLSVTQFCIYKMKVVAAVSPKIKIM